MKLRDVDVVRFTQANVNGTRGTEYARTLAPHSDGIYDGMISIS